MARRSQSLQRPWEYAPSTWPDGPFDDADGAVAAHAAARAARIAKLLRRHRGEQLISRPQLARTAGVSPQTVGNVEMGRVWPDLATLVALARAVELSVEELVKGLRVKHEPT